jgi:CHAT domain-containing protein/tetratricopeptide (TPR) repeat protein
VHRRSRFIDADRVPRKPLMLVFMLGSLGGVALTEGGVARIDPQSELVSNKEFHGELPAKSATGETREVVLDLVPTNQEPITLQGSSVDFDLALSVEDPSSGNRKEDRNSWPQYNAWLVYEPASTARLRVHVTAEDGRGGTFVLLARSGRFDPPTDLREKVQSAIAQCAAIATRAEEAGELQRAARHAGIAAEAAFRIVDHVTSERHAEHELALARRGALELETARAELNLGAARRMMGKPDSAETLLRSARPALFQLLAAADNATARADAAKLCWFLCDNLGDLLRDTRGPEAAQSVYEDEVELVEAIPDARFQASTWLKLAENSAALGDRARAHSALASGLTIAELSKNPELIANALLRNGRVLLLEDRMEEARDVLRRAMELTHDPLRRIDTLGALVTASLGSGRYEEAECSMDELEALKAASMVPSYATKILTDRSVISYALGDVEGAVRFAEAALAEAEDHGTPLERADAIINLANYQRCAGRPEFARAFLADTCALLERGATPQRNIRPLFSLGDAEDAVGDLSGADRSYGAALAFAIDKDNAVETAGARAGRAYVWYHAGSFASARAEAALAADAFERIGDSSRALDAYDTLARVALATGDADGVAECLCRADEHVERLSSDSLDELRKGSLRSRFAAWGAIAQDLQALRLSVAHTTGARRFEDTAAAWSNVQRWKARVLLERSSSDPATHKRDLRDPAANGGADALPPIDAHTAVIEFSEGLETLYAYVYDGRSLQMLDLGRLTDIEPHALRFTRLVSDPLTTEDDWLRESEWLYGRLIAPTASLLDGRTSTLVIVPSPIVSLLPFDALAEPRSAADPESADEQREPSFLVDKYIVVCTPSRELLRSARASESGTRARRFLILGDPLMRNEVVKETRREPRVAARASDTLEGLGRLKNTREEALQVTSAILAWPTTRERIGESRYQKVGAELLDLRTQRSGEIATPVVDLWLGSEASSARLAVDLSGYTDIHFACHGWIDARDSRHSGLVLAYEPVSSGLVALIDLCQRKFDADLVVLSACKGANGRIVHGEGVQSVAYALFLAGARGVVASLWEVEDERASEFMKAFYDQRFGARAEVDAATALRTVKSEMRRAHRLRGESPRSDGRQRSRTLHPYYWAAFLYFGSPH